VKNIKTFLLNKSEIDRQIEMLKKDVSRKFKFKKLFRRNSEFAPFHGIELQRLVDLLELLKTEETLILKLDKWR